MADTVPDSREEGYALVSAIMALGILILLASSMVAVSSVGVFSARSDVERSQAEAIADAGLVQVALALEDSRQDARPRVDGVPSRVDVFDVRTLLQVEDEFGKVDLNAAPPVLLSRLFQTTGISAVQSDQLAAQVDAWRSDGSIGSDRLASPSYQAPRRVFRFVDQLLLVSGISIQLFDAIEPALTVYSGREQVDQTVAPYAALLATGNLGPDEARRIIEERVNGDDSEQQLSVIKDGRVLAGIDQRGWPFRIRFRFESQGGIYCLDAAVRLTGSVAPGYVVSRYKFSSCGMP